MATCSVTLTMLSSVRKLGERKAKTAHSRITPRKIIDSVDRNFPGRVTDTPSKTRRSQKSVDRSQESGVRRQETLSGWSILPSTSYLLPPTSYLLLSAS